MRFTVGDWVKARTAEVVPAGTRGIVRQVLQAMSDVYYVQFDGYDYSTLMHARELEGDDEAGTIIQVGDLLPCILAAASLATVL
jgi:hypothetical protein